MEEMMFQEVIQYLRLDQIECAAQIRDAFAEESLLGLARSIQEVGLQQPIRVRREGPLFKVVDGHRRLGAVKKIPGSKMIAAIVEEKELSAGEVIQRQLINNLQRVDLTPLAKARGIEQLMVATGWSATQAAGKIGMSNSAVTKLLALISLPESIRAQVESGAISAGAGYELARVDNPDKQAELARQVAERRLTRDGLTELTKAEGDSEIKTSNRLASRATAMLSSEEAVTVKAPGLTLERFIEVIESVLSRARRARGRMELKKFVQALRDEAKASLIQS
jgi:ParB family chromosome partitioning protein